MNYEPTGVVLLIPLNGFFCFFLNHVFFKHVYPILNITQSLHVSPGHQKGFLLERPLWRSFLSLFSFIKYD